MSSERTRRCQIWFTNWIEEHFSIEYEMFIQDYFNPEEMVDYFAALCEHDACIRRFLNKGHFVEFIEELNIVAYECRIHHTLRADIYNFLLEIYAAERFSVMERAIYCISQYSHVTCHLCGAFGCVQCPIEAAMIKCGIRPRRRDFKITSTDFRGILSMDLFNCQYPDIIADPHTIQAMKLRRGAFLKMITFPKVSFTYDVLKCIECEKYITFRNASHSRSLCISCERLYHFYHFREKVGLLICSYAYGDGVHSILPFEFIPYIIKQTFPDSVIEDNISANIGYSNLSFDQPD